MTIYSIPVTFEEEGFAELVVRRLGLPQTPPQMEEWKNIVERVLHPTKEVRIAVVGKYIANGDAYISIRESLQHAGIANDCRVDVDWIDSEELEGDDAEARLAGHDGIVVCPGFGARGVEGKINAVRYARENGVPFLGICYGMQMAVIEPCLPPERRKYDGSQPRYAAPRHFAYAGSVRRHRQRGDHAPRSLAVPPRRRLPDRASVWQGNHQGAASASVRGK
jgi:hypothetical protein